MVKENIRIFAISINKQESGSDLSYSQESESESEFQTTDSPALGTPLMVYTLLGNQTPNNNKNLH